MAPAAALPAEPQRSNTLPPTRPSRPKFNSMLTSDRLRESYLYRGPLPAATTAAASSRKPRRSVFRELGLGGDDDAASDESSSAGGPSPVLASPGPGTDSEGRWKAVDWDAGEEAASKMRMGAQAPGASVLRV